MIRTFLKPLSFIPAILLMYMIFSFSAQDGELSSSVSYKASVAIVKAADYVFDLNLESWQVDQYAVRIGGVTRKAAHVTEYFLLAIAVSFPLYVYGLHGILLMLCAGAICVAFAAGDEYHQSFVAGRSPTAKDVGIDSIGILLGIILVRIIGFTGRHTLFRSREETADKREIQKLRRQQARLEQQLERQEHEEYRERYDESANLRKPSRRARQQVPYRGRSGRYEEEERRDADIPYEDERSRGRGVPYEDKRSRKGLRPYRAEGFRAEDDRYDDGRYGDGRYDDGRYDDRYDDDCYDDDRYDDDRYDDDRYDDDRYDDDRYDDGRRYGNDFRDGEAYRHDPYDNPEDDAAEDTSDVLAEDMPLSHLLHRDKR